MVVFEKIQFCVKKLISVKRSDLTKIAYLVLKAGFVRQEFSPQNYQFSSKNISFSSKILIFPKKYLSRSNMRAYLIIRLFPEWQNDCYHH